MTETAIIEHLRNDKYSVAVKGLYDLFPAIRKYVRANQGSADDAEDIFQDTLVILYKKAQDEKFTLTVPLKTYLYAVAKNLWLQELRRRKKLPAGEMPEDIIDITGEEQDPGLAKTAFNLLGEKCRQLLILFYFKKKSFREITGELAFSDENVAKNQKYRCLQKAKENFLTLSTSDSHE